MKIEIGIEDSHRKGASGLLSKLLADEALLYQKTRKYHWNVVGQNFAPLHKLFEKQYTALADTIDEIAERIRSLGEAAIGTYKEFLELTRLQEDPNDYPDAVTMIQKLLKDHETIIRQLRKDIDVILNEYHDVGSSDFLTALLESHEKDAWFLRSHLE